MPPTEAQGSLPRNIFRAHTLFVRGRQLRALAACDFIERRKCRGVADVGAATG